MFVQEVLCEVPYWENSMPFSHARRCQILLGYSFAVFQTLCSHSSSWWMARCQGVNQKWFIAKTGCFFFFFFYVHPEPWGRWDEPNLTSPHMFQMGWFKKPTRRGFQTCLLMEHLLSNEHRAGSGSKSKMISNISPLDLDIFWYVKRHEILPYIFML